VQTEDQEKVLMTNRDGKKYVCALPNPRVQHGGEAAGLQNGSNIGLAMDESTTRKPPEELLEALEDLCFRRVIAANLFQYLEPPHVY
jgi:protein OS-9